MKKILLFLVLFSVLALSFAWLRYGGGDAYPDLTTAAALDASALEEVLSYSEPVGSVAVSAAGRIFFTVHPESRPAGNRLLEYVDGASVPYPDGAAQARYFDTVIGLAIDRQGRLWTIDHGNHGLRIARLLAFDLETGDLVHEHRFDSEIAPAGSYLQDLQVSADGSLIVIADASIWRQSAALVVYDVKSGSARRILEAHESVSAQDYVVEANGRVMSFMGGIISLRGGVDGLALTDDWLYFGALSGSGLYRLNTDDLRDASLPSSQLAARVERVATKPLSNGFAADASGNVYLADIEHNAIAVAEADGAVRTLLRSTAIRWPNGLAFGPDGWLYLSDSALDEVVFMPREAIAAAGPYSVFRFQPASDAAATAAQRANQSPSDASRLVRDDL